MDIIIGEGTNKMVLSTLTAYVSVDKEGNEGIISTYTPSGWIPAIWADDERIQQLFPIVESLCRRNNIEFRVLRFEFTENITEQVKKKYGRY